MDTPKQRAQEDNLQDSTARIAEEIVGMFELIEGTPHLDYDDKILIQKALEGVKFELFPKKYQSDDEKKKIANLANRYQAQKYIIHLIDEWLRTRTDTNINVIQNVQTSLKYFYEIN